MRRDLKNRRPLHRQEKQKGERRRSRQARVRLDACVGFRPGMGKVTPHGRRPISSGVSGYHKVRVGGSTKTTGAGENIFFRVSGPSTGPCRSRDRPRGVRRPSGVCRMTGGRTAAVLSTPTNEPPLPYRTAPPLITPRSGLDSGLYSGLRRTGPAKPPSVPLLRRLRYRRYQKAPGDDFGRVRPVARHRHLGFGSCA